MRHTIALIILVAASPLLAEDSVLEISSGEDQVALLELYTSEGCSSCPPADRWVSRLKDDPKLWQTFIPVAFHVDYWDYIGWRDEFAKPEYATRQRRYIDEGAAKVVYTPGVFQNGEEWLNWRRVDQPHSDTKPVGQLAIQIDSSTFDAQFSAHQSTRDDLILHVAILGMNLQTRVRAGENMGKTLHHDFVVVGMSTVALEYSDGSYVASAFLPKSHIKSDQQAIVAWISSDKQQAPIQSVGGFLPRW